MSAGGRPQGYFVDATDARWSGTVTGLGLLADDCDLNEDEREERDGEIATTRRRSRASIRVGERSLRDSLERSVIERWLRSFL